MMLRLASNSLETARQVDDLELENSYVRAVELLEKRPESRNIHGLIKARDGSVHEIVWERYE